jgi:hypothetical protein
MYLPMISIFIYLQFKYLFTYNLQMYVPPTYHIGH